MTKSLNELGLREVYAMDVSRGGKSLCICLSTKLLTKRMTINMFRNAAQPWHSIPYVPVYILDP